jgi:hypothetical protein
MVIEIPRDGVKVAAARRVFKPHPEERRLRRVSKDEARRSALWFETRAKSALLTMRG